MRVRIIALVALVAAVWVLPASHALAGRLQIDFDLSSTAPLGQAEFCCQQVDGSVSLVLSGAGVGPSGPAMGTSVGAVLSGLTLQITLGPMGPPLGPTDPGLAIILRTQFIQPGAAAGTFDSGRFAFGAGALQLSGNMSIECQGVGCALILLAPARGPFTFSAAPGSLGVDGVQTLGAAQLLGTLVSLGGDSLQLRGLEVNRSFVPEPRPAGFAFVAAALGLVASASLAQRRRRHASSHRAAQTR